MQTNNINNLEEFLNSWTSYEKYFDMLKLMAQLSRLFSESDIPYLDYRLTENLFCRYYKAYNDARSCTAYDARFSTVGIGIKTFILKNDQSVEKIAEFNRLKRTLNGLHGIDLAKQLGQYRNDRMRFANDQYGVAETQYHIVGRTDGLLRIFNTPYEEVDLEHIHLISDDETSCKFEDERNEFSFNKSKSVLMKRFYVPSICKDVKVDIIEDPLALLESFFMTKKEVIKEAKPRIKGVDYVILPLYSLKKGIKYIPEKSGLNQFNAGGRKRNPLEVYVPVPIAIHKNYPDFFPKRDTPFALEMPDKSILNAKICQDNGKSLMSNPNKDLGEWLLRKILHKKEFELVTIDDLNRLGFDSICIENLHKNTEEGEALYRISFSNTDVSYEDFLGDSEQL